MDWRKHLFVEHLVSTLRAKRRLFSGFALCLALSLLAFYLLIPITSTTDTSFSPLFSWFSSLPNARNSSLSRPTKPNSTETANASERSHFYGNYTGLEKTHLTNSSLGSGSGSSSENSPTFGSNSSRSSAESGVEKGQIAKSPSGGGAEMESVGVVGKSNGSGSSEGEGSKGVVSKKCDIFDGTWVRDDDRKPYYPPGSCPHIDIDFNCIKNGRPDSDFLMWRWQPNGCNIPRLNATDFMERLRGKRLIFVGDSLNRNMWESLVCILRQSVADKKRVFEISGKSQFKTRGYYAFKFEDYNCNIEFVQSTFLVKEIYVKGPSGKVEEKLRLDLLDQATSAYRDAAVVVFNTGHWWTHDKTKKGENYYQEGNYVHPLLKVNKAYAKALTTWAKWVDKYINPDKTRVIFRGYSHIHFRGGRWNSGGQCHKETEPIFNQTFLKKYPAKMRILDQVLKQMKTPVTFLNISRLTDYRKDGHPSIYRKRYKTVEEQIAAESSQDCSHWCLPGIPDTWNELLYASLLMDGKGSWKT